MTVREVLVPMSADDMAVDWIAECSKSWLRRLPIPMDGIVLDLGGGGA